MIHVPNPLRIIIIKDVRKNRSRSVANTNSHYGEKKWSSSGKRVRARHCISMTKKKKQEAKHEQKASKNASRSYTPLSDALCQPNLLIDNEFSESMKRFKIATLLGQCLSKQRKANSVNLTQITMTLLMWPILKLDSIHCFCSELCQFMDLGKDNPQRPAEVIYDFWGREDINWRKFAQKVTHKVYQELSFNQDPDLCFVVDDTLKARRGKKVEGTSQHHDHNSGKTLQGHQLLELGLVGEKGFIPLDRQIYMGNKNAITKPEGKEFHDQRSACARDMKRAQEEDKNQMLKRMMKSAMQGGYRARYLLGDSWFGNKGNIQAALDLGLHCIFQMKRGKQIYLVDGKKHTANSLYTKYQRKLTGDSDKGLYKTFRIEAQINLETDQAKPPRWQEVILVLSTPKREGAENWVIFLTTDLSLSSEQVLSIYSKRWAIEVYFKEAKQSFGLLKEQSGKYTGAHQVL